MNTLFASIMILNAIFAVAPPADANRTIDCKPHYLENYYLPAWVTNDTWYREMPQYTVGKAVWYAPGLMNSTAKFRGMSLEGFKGGVATNSVDMMGKTVWLKRVGLPWEGPFLVVDVGQRNHAYHQAVNVKTIVEVDFKTAIKWGIVSYNSGAKKGYQIDKWYEGGVEMWAGLEMPTHEAETATEAIVYNEWYEENAKFCDGEKNRWWSLQDWMITDYSEYEEELSRLVPPEQPRALMPTVKAPIISTFDLRPSTFKLRLEEYFLLKAKEKPLVAQIIIDATLIEPEPTPVIPEPEFITTHTLQSHETWTHLSLKYYGHTTEPYWRLIYEANQEMVGDDYRRIWGGMAIDIPALPADFSP